VPFARDRESTPDLEVSGRHTKLKSGRSTNKKDSYRMSSSSPNNAARKETNIHVHSAQHSPDQDIQQGRYLDTQHAQSAYVAETGVV
jgi:hypothetical protein